MFKALKSFSGKITMAKGQEKEIKDPALIQDLLNAGYIVEVKSEKVAEKIKEEIKKEVSKVETKLENTKNTKKNKSKK